MTLFPTVSCISCGSLEIIPDQKCFRLLLTSRANQRSDPQVPDGPAGQTTTVWRITGIAEEWIEPGNHAGSGPDHKTGILRWSLRPEQHRD